LQVFLLQDAALKEAREKIKTELLLIVMLTINKSSVIVTYA